MAFHQPLLVLKLLSFDVTTFASFREDSERQIRQRGRACTTRKAFTLHERERLAGTSRDVGHVAKGSQTLVDALCVSWSNGLRLLFAARTESGEAKKETNGI